MHCLLNLDPCSAEKCDYYGKCWAYPDGTTQCKCEEECTPAQKSGLVCGSDNKIYVHECALRKYVCAKKLNVSIKNAGVCGELFCYTIKSEAKLER